ncbi:MAG: DUF2442 domain-containing protein [Oscillospiraceae bacterium]|nr:DUF2442 domain-containing protein [Oscillospiraceae bacterium]
MNKVNDEIISRGKLAPRAASIAPLEGYRLDITFTNGERRIFDCNELLQYPAFAPIKDKAIFEQVTVEYGSPSWCDGDIDYCPDCLYIESTPVDTV